MKLAVELSGKQFRHSLIASRQTAHNYVQAMVLFEVTQQFQDPMPPAVTTCSVIIITACFRLLRSTNSQHRGLR